MLLTQLCAVMKRQDKENTCRLEVSFWPFMGESLSTSTSEVFLIEIQKCRLGIRFIILPEKNFSATIFSQGKEQNAGT